MNKVEQSNTDTNSDGKLQENPKPILNSSEELQNSIEQMSKNKSRKKTKKNTAPASTESPVEVRNFIVGIGASAGGLEALSDLIRLLPNDLGVPYIIVQHLSPTYRSMMVPLLARETSMLVKEAEDGEIPLVNVIYVTPANWNIILKDGAMRLLVPGKTVLPKPSATVLFNSMAEDKGEDSIGVILSGTGSDGSAGIAAIKAVGGFTFAQDPEDAKYSGMPQAAISTGCVEWVLSCKGIAEEITAIARAHGLIDRTPKQDNSPASMKSLLQMVFKQSKIDFSGYKEATLSRRVERRMAANRLNNLNDYFEFCSKNPDELIKLSKDILISVTAFFRDRNSFEGLRKTLSEIVAEKHFGDEIRIWVPACATGEEAYSIGILLSSLLGGKLNEYRIQIFATDIDMDAMAVARKGVYSESSLAEVSAEISKRYFSRKGDQYQIARPIRDMVVFARQDLVLDPPFLRLDLISCRNLLIYFQPLLQTRVLSIFHFALRPSGHLFLGKSESIVHQDNLFVPVSKEARIFRRVAGKDQIIPIPLYSNQDASVKSPITITERGKRKPDNKFQKALSELYAPPSMLINKNLDIIELHGEMQNYLQFSPGKLEVNLSQLLRREWRTEVQTLVHHADLKNANATGRIRPSKSKDGHSVKIEVHPMSSRDDQKQFLVSFISLATLMDGSHIADQPQENNSELEDELIATREHLQTVIEELETSNEELQSLNEEMQAANEELQASNEELEASNEELQSTNEELTTVNEELIVKGSELSLVNTELENLQNSTGFSLVLLDQDLRLQRYNKEAAGVFGFSVHTLGKTISGMVLPVTEVLETAQLAMSDGIKRQQQTTFGGKQYNVICFPYTSHDETLGGVIITFIDETELINAQHEMLSSQQRLIALMQNSPMLITIKDPVGRYQFANKAFEGMFQLDQSQIIGKSDMQLFPGSIAAMFEIMHFEVLQKKVRLESEECITIFEAQHWLSFICYPINDDQGCVIGVCSQATDITERKQAAEAIRKSEAKLRLLLDSAAEAIYGIDAQGKCTFCNLSCIRLLGYPNAEALIDKNMHRLIRHSYADGTPFPEQDSLIYRALKSGTNSHADKEVLWRADGTSFPAEYWSHPQLNEGQAVGAVVTFLDISERLQANEKLLKLSRAVDNSPASVVITDVNGTIEHVNRGFLEVTGYTEEEVLGQNSRILKSQVHPAEFYEKLWITILSGKVWQGELCNRKKNGEIYLEQASISPILNENGVITHFVAVKEDITQRKQTELALQQARAVADAANCAKSDFLANMSHEIRTPMNAIIGLINLCLQTELTQKQQDYLQKVNGSAKSLLGIINDILEFSKIEARKLDVEQVRFKLEEVMGNLVTIVSSRGEEKGIEFLFENSLNVPPYLIGDPYRLGQILINLVGNAIKFTEAGEVRVCTEVESETETEISLRFTVQDSGIGMTREQIDRLFTAFTQADATITRKYGGTGLGLSISKQLVELMNGKISVESAPGVGSIFVFTARFQKVPETYTTESYKPATELRELRVLAVDDNASCRRILKSYLESYSFEVTLAGNGAECLQEIEKAESEGNPYRLVILDWKMPEMAGIETASNIRAMSITGDIPKILLLTSYAQSEILRHMAKSVIDGILVKPFQQSELYEAVIEIFGYAQRHENSRSYLFSPELMQMLEGAHILLVEDNEINQMVARELLEKAGVRVTISGNGADAIVQLSEEKFDGVLMDLQMPVMDGLTATREIRKNPKFAQLPIIAMTANVMTRDREHCVAAGMNDYIAKPFDPNQMLAVLAKWISPARPDINGVYTAGNGIMATLPELPGVQVEVGVRRLGGNVGMYYIILKKFRESQQYTLAGIRAELKEKDWKIAEQLAHTLKGLLGTLGASRLKRKVTSLEKAIQDKNFTLVSAQIQTVEEDLLQLFADIDRALQLQAKQLERVAVAMPVNMQELSKLLLQIKHQLEQYDISVDETVLELRQMLRADPQMSKEMARLEQCISRYDYEQGLLVLLDWANSLNIELP